MGRHGNVVLTRPLGWIIVVQWSTFSHTQTASDLRDMFFSRFEASEGNCAELRCLFFASQKATEQLVVVCLEHVHAPTKEIEQ